MAYFIRSDSSNCLISGVQTWFYALKVRFFFSFNSSFIVLDFCNCASSWLAAALTGSFYRDSNWVLRSVSAELQIYYRPCFIIISESCDSISGTFRPPLNKCQFITYWMASFRSAITCWAFSFSYCTTNLASTNSHESLVASCTKCVSIETWLESPSRTLGVPKIGLIIKR